MISEFMSMGIFPAYEGDRVYPNSFQASSVVDIMRLRMRQLGISEICNFNCVSIKKNGGAFIISSESGERINARKVIVCAGGKAAPKYGTDGGAYRLLESFGHKRTPIYPSLVQIKCSSPYLVGMKGVKIDSDVEIYVNGHFVQKEFGELLFTDYGLSGPPIFQLSRIASVSCADGDEVKLKVDLMPDTELDELYCYLMSRSRDVPVEDFLTGMINKLAARQLIKSCGVEKFNTDAHVLSDEMIMSLAKNMKGWEFDAVGTNSWDMAQVTAGGIETDGFDPSTMESKHAAGLYAAGEILDIDGDCGGFNLQWAWSSGAAAGESSAKSVLYGD